MTIVGATKSAACAPSHTEVATALMYSKTPRRPVLDTGLGCISRRRRKAFIPHVAPIRHESQASCQARGDEDEHARDYESEGMTIIGKCGLKHHPLRLQRHCTHDAQ
jgi:hypothetical protein